MTKPSLPQGTRDFGPDVVRRRQYILDSCKEVFELYGFQPLETPAMENLDTLMGKYGDEGDKLIFRILNNGLDRQEKQQQARADFEKLLEGKNVKGLTERALKYDLTIPFARYVAMNYSQLTLPFKRYQIQPVWRADRPQKGRYREFYQCDADIVGSTSWLNELELANIYKDVFEQLKIPVEIHVNSRKILAALAEHCGGADKMMAITIAIDKLDKIGPEKVKDELKDRGLNEKQVAIVENYLSISGDENEKFQKLEKLIGKNEGIEELKKLSGLFTSNASCQLLADFTLARGLNYYTGLIFEVKARNVDMGSIGGGGRYDDLTGLFGVPDVPGVGISFGVDRIYDVMEELKIFPEDLSIGTRVLFFNLGEKESHEAYQLVQQLRKKNIAAELYHEAAKMEKQFKYAEKKGIPYVIIIGDRELKDQTCTLKELASGTQKTLSRQELLKFPFE
ncbi:MAG TPA: histidine--tRNA ligase [Chitinophagaceae bacterium]|nr:histidine--tRNA ligase [Chitinophagaceae bacterium]